jgi:hypothetical protein
MSPLARISYVRHWGRLHWIRPATRARKCQLADRSQARVEHPRGRSVVPRATGRRGPGALVERNITSDDLIAELDRLSLDRGYPAVLRCDNGPELACAAMADWAGERVGVHFIPPGPPWRNGYDESFNSRVRCSGTRPDTCSGRSRRHAW